MSLRLSHQGALAISSGCSPALLSPPFYPSKPWRRRTATLFFLDCQQEIAIIGWLLTEKEEDAIVFEDFPAVYKPAVFLRKLFKNNQILTIFEEEIK